MKAENQELLQYKHFRSLLFRLDPEDAHKLALLTLKLAGIIPGLRSGLRRAFSIENPAIKVHAFGLNFTNPLGLAAGYDKDGLAIYGLACLGFGHLELGTVTLEPQPGNPKPRVFRLVDDQALINRMGFPNQGASRLLARLKNRPPGVVLGVNIGKSKDTPIEEASGDYIQLMELFYDSADYLAVNVSSPNTIGLRKLQGRQYLEALLEDLAHVRTRLESRTRQRRPVLVKLAPDLEEEELDDAVEIILSTGMDGVIIANTTTSREGLQSPYREEIGGMSGLPLFHRSTEMIHHVRSKVGEELPIIGVGGILGPVQARVKLRAGAKLVQVYTGLIYRGPSLVREILAALN